MNTQRTYDPKNLAALSRDLQELRTQARETGVLSSDSKPGGAGGLAASRAAAMQAAGPADKGKQFATRLLAMLRRGEGDTSPIILGTNFTEQGLRKLLDLLASPRKKPGSGEKIFQMLQKFLITSPANGATMIAGVSVEKIRLLSRLLEQIEKHGWEQVRAHRAQRPEPAAIATPAEPRREVAVTNKRKRASRRVPS